MLSTLIVSPKGCSRLPMRMSLLALCASVAIPLPRALAQETQLRGRVTEAQVNGGQDGSLSTPDTGVPLPAYRPASAGALDDEQEAERSGDGSSLFPMREEEATDTFAERTSPRRPARTANARETSAQPRNAEKPVSPDSDDRRANRQGDEEPDDLTVGTVRQEAIDGQDEEANRRAKAENVRTGAIETGSIEDEENPYSPLGLRVGTFDVHATLDQGLTWSSNPNFSPDGGEGVLSETQLRLNAVSDWARHAATINAYGIARESVSGSEVSDLEGGFDAAFRADLAHELTADAFFSYSVRPESASSPVVIVGALFEPLLQDMTGSLGISKGVGKARFGLTGSLERKLYSDADIAGGGTLSQEDRNFTLATVALRAGYEISPALLPFVEGEVGRRFYDLKVDSAGYARSADRLALRTGLELDLGEKLSGEFSAGWLRESFDDDRLTPVSALLLNAALAWSPSRGTTVSLLGSTEVEGTTTADDSGSVRYSASLDVQRQVRSNLTVGATAGLAWRDYIDSTEHELTLSAETNATWWFNRFAGINGRLRHERFDSTLAGRDYEASSVYLGLKLQR